MKYFTGLAGLIAAFILSILITNIPVHAAEAGIDGSLSHSVEIKLPPGTAGLAPKLALVYNSNAGNGMMGQGWSIQGLPVITRDSRVGINYNGTDTYTGSNGRLILQSGDIYHFEYENYSKVQKCGTAGDGPECWVETKADGTKYYYGKYDNNSGDANVKAYDSSGNLINNGSIRVWALSKVEDIYGNYYIIQYFQENGEFYPDKIVYTLANGVSKKRTVEFVYENGRSDYWNTYDQSARVEMMYRLKKIIVNTGVTQFSFFGLFTIDLFGDLVRIYELTYEGGTSGIDFSRLVKIEEFGGGGNFIDYNSFTWTDSGTFTVVTASSMTTPYPNRSIETVASGESYSYEITNGTTITGDINGDGRIDIINMPNLDATNYYVVHGSQSSGQSLNYTWNEYYAPYIYPRSADSVFIEDFNGDGKTDMAWLHEGSPSKMNIDYSNGLTFSRKYLTLNSGFKETLIFGDYDGDGRTDIGSSSYRHDREDIGYSTGTGFAWKSYGLSIDMNDSVVTGDFNGDGLTDICYSDYEHDSLHIGYSTGDGFIWEDYSRSIDKNDRLVTGDFNGDGLTDICYSDYERNYLHVGYSTGHGFTWLEYVIGIESSTKVIAADFNGDGKTDICIGTYTKKTLRFLLSTGNSFSLFTLKSDISSSYWFGSSDIDGDNKDELIVWNDTAFKVYKVQLKPAYITKITKSAGSSIDIGYIQATLHQTAIDPSDSTYPKIANSSPRQLVKSITISDGRGTSYQKSYDYSKGKLFMGLPVDRKNLYFESITETDQATGIITKTYYEQEDEWLAGNPKQIEVNAGGLLLKRDVYTYNKYSTATQYPGTHSVKLLNQSTTTYEGGDPAFTQTKSYVYDAYGNPSNITDGSDGTSTVVTSITYAYDETSNILNRPSEITKTSGGVILQGTKYAYSGAGISGMSVYLNTGGSWLLTSYGTDECGNIISMTDPMGRVTLLEYDSDYKTFISSVTNPLGHTVTMEYDGMGNMLSKTDQNGNTTENEYDGAGRLISVTDANGDIVNIIDYHDELLGDASSQYTETKLKNDSTGTYSSSKSYFDGLGRVYKTVSDAGTVNSEMLVKVEDVEYNAAGKVLRKTIPYIQGKQNPLYIQYGYDAAGRVVTETIPDSETTAVIYTTGYSAGSNSILVTKRDPKGNAWMSRSDSRGKLIRKIEPEGAEVSYTYDAAGKLTGTVDGGGNVTSITYDTLGRKLMISDPNAGTVTYSYDNAGNMLSKTDAAGNTTTYTYDALNRVMLIDYPDTTPDVNYTYDESSSENAKGKVTTVNDGVSVLKYAYDKNGNAEYMRQSVENIDFIFVMEYDSQKRLKSLTYPDGVKIDKEYSEGGYLNSVKQGAGAYVQYGLKTENGTFTNKILRKTGNGVETVIGFNPANNRPVSVESRNENNELLEQNEYTYDSVGNITQIADIMNSKTQTFKYDGLNRLIQAKGAYGTHDYQYSNTGNLISNNYGIMEYSDTAHPNAVTRDGKDNIYVYDVNGNMVVRGEQNLKYDAANRLKEISKNGTSVQEYSYDHSGHRVLKKTSSGAVVYNIAGLYELSKAAATPDTHTKYIHGMEGDIAAQVTTTGTTLVAANFHRGWLYDGKFHSNPLVSILCAAGIKVNEFIGRPGNIWKIERWFLIAFITVLMALAVFSLKKRKFRLPVYPKWSSAVSLLLVVAMFTSLTLTGCGGGGLPGIDSEPETGDISGDDINGIPAKGTYYFHPDHVGSISYLTDSEGKVVSRMSYTPYGEIIKSQSTGTGMYNKKYTGQIYDGEESGLMYYKARYYDPALGRFITADSIIPGMDKTQAFNRYMYVAGNPISFGDPSGHSFKKWVKKHVGGIGGAFTGATWGGVIGATIGFMVGGPPGAAIGGSIGFSAGAAGGGYIGQKAWTNDTSRQIIIITAVVCVLAATAYASPVGAVTGLLNSYYVFTRGGTLTDMAVAYSIGWCAGAYFSGEFEAFCSGGSVENYSMAGAEMHSFPEGSLLNATPYGAYGSQGIATNLCINVVTQSYLSAKRGALNQFKLMDLGMSMASGYFVGGLSGNMIAGFAFNGLLCQIAIASSYYSYDYSENNNKYENYYDHL